MTFKGKLFFFMAIFGAFLSCGNPSTKKEGKNIELSKPKKKTSQTTSKEIETLLKKNTCFACHKAKGKLIGPSYEEIAQKGYSEDRFIELVRTPEPENWPGYVPMIGLPNVPKEDLKKIAQWVNTLVE